MRDIWLIDYDAFTWRELHIGDRAAYFWGTGVMRNLGHTREHLITWSTLVKDRKNHGENIVKVYKRQDTTLLEKMRDEITILPSYIISLVATKKNFSMYAVFELK